MHAQYVQLIADLDRVLALVRSAWLAAADHGPRQEWYVRLNELLDERLRLMRCRDALAA